MPALPKPGDPLIDEKGRLILADGLPAPDLALTTPLARLYKPKTLRSSAEMPSDEKTQTVINAVLIYSLLGMTDNEISHVLGCTIPDIEHMKGLDAYQETFEMLFKELISVNSSSIQARIQRMAGKAFENVAELANYTPELDEDGNPKGYVVPPIVKYKANADILDRAGLNAEQMFGKGAPEDDTTFKIEIVEAKDSKTNININVNPAKRR